MEFPDSYFEDEVREGFYIPSLMKRAWAAQMEMLEELQKICEKHDIRYFAEWGTLLGAIRHGGFVPWDDDLDICMLRDDYDRFRAVVDEELPEGCWYADWRWSDDFDHDVGRLINSRYYVVSGETLEKYHGYPYVAGLDIFWIDSLPEETEEKAYIEKFTYVYSLIQTIRRSKSGEIQFTPKELEYHTRKVEELCQVSLDRNKPIKQQLYELVETKVAPQYRDSGTKDVSNLPVWVLQTGYRLPKSCFAGSVSMPFENMEIMVPAGYDELLRRKYGQDWMRPVRTGGSHGYPNYREQQKFLEEKSGPQMLEYQFSKDEMERIGATRLPKITLQEKVKGFLPLFHEAHEEIQNSVNQGAIQQALALLGECQTAAIELGTMIEEERGEGHATVRVLEQYCESIFQLHTRLTEQSDLTHEEESFDEVQDELTAFEERLADSAGQDLKEKREVVFIPYKSAFWQTMESEWQRAAKDEETEVYVIPAPYYYKDAYGREKIGEPHYETNYPENVTITSYGKYDFEKRHPEMIVIQYPYDEYNHGLTVDPFFYAKNMKQYTEQLVYIPPLIMDEIGPEDERARETLKSFCNMPGVVHADKVIVQSEQMKQVYVELLTEFAGEDTRQIWENKILPA